MVFVPGQYSLIWYQCACTNRMRVWNNRQWQPPQLLPCTACGDQMQWVDKHLNFKRRVYDPPVGMTVLVDLDLATANSLIDRRCHGKEVSQETRQMILDDLYQNGRNHFVTVAGYLRLPESY